MQVTTESPCTKEDKKSDGQRNHSHLCFVVLDAIALALAQLMHGQGSVKTKQPASRHASTGMLYCALPFDSPGHLLTGNKPSKQEQQGLYFTASQGTTKSMRHMHKVTSVSNMEQRSAHLIVAQVQNLVSSTMLPS